LRLRDDGSGIDPAVLSRQGSEGHYGLPGTRERATIIGGELTVWSAFNADSEVERAFLPHRLRLIGGPRRPLMQHELLHEP
jgi:nitrate/nitrite-specific signal transduction histidine kinase